MLFEHLEDAQFWGEQYQMRTKKAFWIIGRVIRKSNKVFLYQLVAKNLNQ